MNLVVWDGRHGDGGLMRSGVLLDLHERRDTVRRVRLPGKRASWKPTRKRFPQGCSNRAWESRRFTPVFPL